MIRPSPHPQRLRSPLRFAQRPAVRPLTDDELYRLTGRPSVVLAELLPDDARPTEQDRIAARRDKGLMISTEAGRPTSIGDKIICAKSVMQAIRAAHDSQALDGENYDVGWPLGLAIDLLEEASNQLSKAETRGTRS